MVRKAIGAIVGKINGLKQAAFWLSVFALVSQVLALARDRLLAHNFGAGEELDIYYAAFKVPDLLFVTVASLVSISALVPLFAKKETEGERHLSEATGSIFTVFSFLIVLSSLFAYFFMPHIIPATFSSLSEYAKTEIIFLSRVLLLSPLLLGFSNFFGSIVQYQNRFILYSLSPILYNIGIIAGIVFGVDSYGITAAVIGVCIGAFLHLALQAIFVIYSDLRPRFTFRIKWNDVKETAMLSIPRTLALSITSFTAFVFVVLAGKLAVGSIAVFNFSFNLQSAPLSLIGVSFSLAAFPALAVSAARRNIDEIVEKISEGLRQIIFWSLPATALIIILRAHIVRVVLGSGSFDWADTRLTAAALSVFIFSTVFQSIQLFLSRSLYALGKTKWPLLANVLGGVFSMALSFYFISNQIRFAGFFNFIANLLNVEDLNTVILSLPLAFSLGFLLSSFLLFLALGKEIVKDVWKAVSKTFLESATAAFAAGTASYMVLAVSGRFFDFNTFTGIFSHGLIGGLVGIAVLSVVLYSLGNKEIKEMVTKL